MPAQTSSTTEFALRLEGVALGYGDFTVLRDISMDVRAGHQRYLSSKEHRRRVTLGDGSAMRGSISLSDDGTFRHAASVLVEAEFSIVRPRRR